MSSGLNYGGVVLAVATLALLVVVQPETSAAVLEAGKAGDGVTAPHDAFDVPLLTEALGSAGGVGAGGLDTPGEGTRHRVTVPAASGGGSLNATSGPDASAAPASPPPKLWDRLSPGQRHAFGTTLALVAGALSGSTFTAPQ